MTDKNITTLNSPSSLNIFERHPHIIAVIALFVGSCSGVLGKLITANSMAIGFYRLTFSLPFFAVPLFFKHREMLKNLTKKDILSTALVGFFLFVHFFAWFKAVQTTTIASAIVFQALNPITVLLITVLIFRQPVKGKAVLGIFIALIGGAIIAGFDYKMAGDTFSGNLFALLAGTMYAFYFCIGNVLRKRIPATAYVFLVFFFCWIFFILGMIGTGTPFVGYPSMDYVWLLLMALFCQIGSHAVNNWCLGYVSPLFLSTLGTGEIAISTLLAMIVVAEIPTLWQCIGAVIVIVGLICYNLNSQLDNNSKNK